MIKTMASLVYQNTLLQELICIFGVIVIIGIVISQIFIINKLRNELIHIRTIIALIAEKNGVMIRIQCPECENQFWEDATNKQTVCNYCKTEFNIQDSNIIKK